MNSRTDGEQRHQSLIAIAGSTPPSSRPNRLAPVERVKDHLRCPLRGGYAILDKPDLHREMASTRKIGGSEVSRCRDLEPPVCSPAEVPAD